MKVFDRRVGGDCFKEPIPLVTTVMTLDTGNIDYLRELAIRYSGNRIHHCAEHSLATRFNGVAIDNGLEGIGQLVAEIRKTNSPTLQHRVAESITNNETGFFRDSHLFDALRWSVLPALINENRSRKSLRIWSAACSSGQEAVSVAILIHQHFPEIADWNIEILGTDLSDRMLSRARSGMYSLSDVNRGLSFETLRRFFVPAGREWRLGKRLQDVLHYQRINLVRDLPDIGIFDIVLARNVLIYFDPLERLKALGRVRDCLCDEGYLFMGSAETAQGLAIPYDRQMVLGKASYRPIAC